MKALAVFALVTVSLAPAGIIGQWDGDGKAVTLDNANISWNYATTTPTYATNMVRDLMTGDGATVGPDAPITAANLAGYDSFVMRIPAAAPTAAELSDLSNWVTDGGLLLMFADSSMATAPFNAVFTGVGSSMRMGGTVNQNFYFTSGLFLTDGVVGSFVSPTVGLGIVGGTSLTRGGPTWTASQQAQAASYIHYEQIGRGYVIAFADTIDCNYVLNSNGAALDHMFGNIAGYVNPHGGTNPPADTPEPAAMLLTGAGLATLAFFRGRFARSRG